MNSLENEEQIIKTENKEWGKKGEESLSTRTVRLLFQQPTRNGKTPSWHANNEEGGVSNKTSSPTPGYRREK